MSGCGPENRKFKTAEANSKYELRRLGIIDKFLNILDYPNFVKKNRSWTDFAKSKYGISGKLFYEENNKALPNKEAFKIIDNSNGVFYQIATTEQVSPQINYSLKAINILQSDRAKQMFEKGQKNSWSLDKILTELQIPKEQKQLIKDLNITDREQLALELASKYSFTVEVNTSIAKETYVDPEYGVEEEGRPTQNYANLTVPGGTNYTENEITTPLITPSIKGHAQFSTDNGIGWFRSDDRSLNQKNISSLKQQNWTAEQMEEAMIRTDGSEQALEDYLLKNYPDRTKGDVTKTRRILEVQSDLFQKGRDKKDLIIPKINELDIREYEVDGKTYFKLVEEDGSEILAFKSKQEVIDAYAEMYNIKNINTSNEFLQLLNKSNNWVTFFVKSIIQDSAKKGYEKVLFPTGNTASKVEGHTTLEEFKKQKEDRIKELQNRLTEKKYAIFNKEGIFSAKNLFKTKEEAVKYLKENYDNTYTVNEAPKYDGFEVPINKEIETLKQELTDVESGQTQLSSIANFYENTVTNILKKQGLNPVEITDEYGNTWNEIAITPEVKNQQILLQQEERKVTPAPAPLITKIRKILSEKGVSVQGLLDYAEAHPEINVDGVNGLADLVNGIIAIAQGRTDVALTEEFVHIATALIELHTPQVMTGLIKNIDKYQVFKDTLAKYKDNKAYQLPNGKPDIRKIKKEAIDTAISEIIVNGSRESSNYPDLFEPVPKDFFQRMWDSVLEFIRKTFGKDYRADGIAQFENVASQIMEGNIPGQASDLQGGVFFQISDEVKQKIDEQYNKNKQMHNDLELVPGDDRHYIYKGVTRVAKSVTEKIKGQISKLYSPTEMQEDMYEQMKVWGIKGHIFLQQYFTKNLIDENGYALKKFKNDSVDTDLSKSMQKALATFAKNLISSYPEGTRFLVENMVVNTEAKGLLASTTDFKAIYPAKDKKGKEIFKVDTLDWKFYSTNKEVNEDINFYKQDEWIKQMGEYTKIDRNLGVSAENMGRYRMIPFLMDYRYTKSIKNKNKVHVLYNSIEIGNVDPKKESSIYLLPVPSPMESTGVEELDDMLSQLRAYHNRLRKISYKGNQAQNKQELTRLSVAIRSLHVKNSFEPISLVMNTFINRARAILKEMNSKKFEDMSLEELRTNLALLIQYNENAETFANTKDVFVKMFGTKNLDKESATILKELSEASTKAKQVQELILEKQKQFAQYQAGLEGIDGDVTKSELPFTSILKNFTEQTKVPVKLVNLVVNMIMTAASQINMATSKSVSKYFDLLDNLEDVVGKGKGWNAIAGVKNGEMELHKKFSDEFFDQLKNAYKTKNRSFLLKNVDTDVYNKLVNDHLKAQFEIINSTEYSILPNLQERAIENDKIRVERIQALRKQFNLGKESFSGFENPVFKAIYLESLKDNKENYSKEYIAMQKIPAALEMWNYMLDWNRKARDMGYLKGKSIYFFPKVEESIVAKVGQAEDKVAQVGRSAMQMFIHNIDEQHNLGKVDSSTGALKKSIPKYYTESDKKLSELSRDLNKVGPLWIQSVIGYETSVNLEETFQTILAVEKHKPPLTRDNDGNVIFKNTTEPLQNKKDEEKANFKLLETLVDEFLYKIGDDISSIRDIDVTSVVKKMLPKSLQDNLLDENNKAVINPTKTLANLDVWTRALGVGWSYAIAIANTFGANLHAAIYGGRFYTVSEFLKYEIKSVAPNTLTDVQQALLHYIVPVNEDTLKILERERFFKKGKIRAYLATYSFQDFMMWTNSYPDSRIQMANALAMMDNSMVRDGKIVNIREYLRQEDAKTKYDLSYSERRELEKSFESRVKALKDKENLFLVAKIEGDELIIPGVSTKEIARYRVGIIEFARKLNGQMSRENRMAFTRNGLFKSFMMFKTWMPKLFGERLMDINKNVQLDQWEYGRMRIFWTTLGHMISQKSFLISDILSGNEKGLEHLRMMLEEKRKEHFLKTGKELEIQEAEYFDLVRRELEAQMKELAALVAISALVIGSAAMEPPEDTTPQEKNALKAVARQINKVYEEISFYYNPISIAAMTKGAFLPSLSTLAKVTRIGEELIEETFTDGEESYPIKATINVIPLGNRFFRDVLPILDPDITKELGIRPTSESRSFF